MGTKYIQGNLNIEGQVVVDRIYPNKNQSVAVEGDLYVDSDVTVIDGVNIDGDTTIKGTLTLPNSPTTPDTATITDTYTSRTTAKGDYEIVGGSTTLVKNISGSTVKCENLIPFPYTGSTIENGVSFNTLEDGTIILNGKNDGNGNSSRFIQTALSLGKGTYTLGITTSTNSNILLMAQITLNGNTTYHTASRRYPKTLTFDEDTTMAVYVQVPKGTEDTLSNVIVKPMLNKGETALPWQPYFTDLKNVEIDGITSKSKNLFNPNRAFKQLPDEFANTAQRLFEEDALYAGISYNNYYSATTIEGYNYENGTISFSTKKQAYGVGIPFRVIPNTKYTFSMRQLAGKTLVVGVGFYANDGTFISFDTGNSFTTQSNCAWVLIVVNSKHAYYTAQQISYTDIQLEQNDHQTEYVPYVEDVYKLPQTLELGKWDSFNPQTGELTRGTKTIVLKGTEHFHGYSDTPEGVHTYVHPINGKAIGYNNAICTHFDYLMASWGKPNIGVFSDHPTVNYLYFNSDIPTLEEWKAYVAQLFASGNPLTITYKLETPTIEKFENVLSSYNAYDGGTETILGNDNAIYGAIPTITQTYAIHENPTEAANKAYVNNGLAKKLDKTGGTITGHLVVENGTNTTLPALVVKNNAATYGLVLEDDTYKLGKGTVDENNRFTFDNGEGLPIALRSDSSEFTKEHLVKWSEEGNKLVDSGISTTEVAKKKEVDSLSTTFSNDITAIKSNITDLSSYINTFETEIKTKVTSVESLAQGAN